MHIISSFLHLVHPPLMLTTILTMHLNNTNFVISINTIFNKQHVCNTLQTDSLKAILSFDVTL